MISKKFLKILSVAVGGYLAGVSTEKFFKVSFEDDEEDSIFNHGVIRPRPGLPIFGTVSAATLIPTKSNLNETISSSRHQSLLTMRVSSFTGIQGTHTSQVLLALNTLTWNRSRDLVFLVSTIM